MSNKIASFTFATHKLCDKMGYHISKMDKNNKLNDNEGYIQSQDIPPTSNLFV